MIGSQPKIARNKKIVAMRKQGKTFQEIGDKLGISKARALEIYTRETKDK
jgi:DNA-binding CsgD family transcriptional regulator